MEGRKERLQRLCHVQAPATGRTGQNRFRLGSATTALLADTRRESQIDGLLHCFVCILVVRAR